MGKGMLWWQIPARSKGERGKGGRGKGGGARGALLCSPRPRLALAGPHLLHHPRAPTPRALQVVAPAHLLGQWATEARKFCGGALRVIAGLSAYQDALRAAGTAATGGGGAGAGGAPRLNNRALVLASVDEALGSPSVRYSYRKVGAGTRGRAPEEDEEGFCCCCRCCCCQRFSPRETADLLAQTHVCTQVECSPTVTRTTSTPAPVRGRSTARGRAPCCGGPRATWSGRGQLWAPSPAPTRARSTWSVAAPGLGLGVRARARST